MYRCVLSSSRRTEGGACFLSTEFEAEVDVVLSMRVEGIVKLIVLTSHDGAWQCACDISQIVAVQPDTVRNIASFPLVFGGLGVRSAERVRFSAYCLKISMESPCLTLLPTAFIDTIIQACAKRFILARKSSALSGPEPTVRFDLALNLMSARTVIALSTGFVRRLLVFELF